LPAEALAGNCDVLIKIRGHKIKGIIESYGHAEIGDLVSVIDSEGYVEVSVVNGDAASTLGAETGDVVEVILNAA
jgi:S-adenosylmethionine hydrolase